jgi:hypothetical protein
MRYPTHFGGLEAILRTTGPFTLAYHGNDSFSTALEVARNLHTYFYADAELVDGNAIHTSIGNQITISVGNDIPTYLCTEDFPISLCANDDGTKGSVTLSLRALHPPAKTFKLDSGQIEAGAIFLRPISSSLGETLELVIWGSDTTMLSQAARLVPMMTGTGQPDFIVLDRSAAWRGVDGTSLGWFDAWWEMGRGNCLSLTSHSEAR